MHAEIKLGFNSTACPVGAFAKVNTKIFGYWFALVSIMILGFYTVVSGASLAFFADSILNFDLTWDIFTSSFHFISFWSLIFLFLTTVVVSLGVTKGLERANFWLIPLLYLSLLFIVLACFNLDGFSKAFNFVFSFNISSLSLDLIAAAAGQSLFSLAVGAGCLIAYGSYTPKDIKIGFNLVPIVIMTIIVGILSTLSVLTIVNTYNLGLVSGPELMFISLPVAFIKMPYGFFISKLFFGILVMAAITSAISFLEVLIQVFNSQFGINRKKALNYIFVLMSVIILILCFGFYKKEVTFFNKNIFELVVYLSTNIFLPLSALMLCYAKTYFLIKKEINLKNILVLFWYAIIIPGVIIAFLSRFIY